jgi:hypothetical protein
MKQETLEEAMNKNGYHDKESDDLWREGVEFGAKWQAERMYSEEVINEMFDTLKRNAVNNVATITNIDLFISSWKRELKNK